MENLIDIVPLRQAFAESAQRLASGAAAFLPKVLWALLILALGWATARLAQAVVRRVLAKVGLDKMASALRIVEPMRQAGMSTTVSALVARIVFWGLFLTAILFAVQALGIEAVGRTIERITAYLPNVFAAAVIVGIGIPLCRLIRNLVVSAASAAKVPQARRLGSAAMVATSSVIVILALSQMGVRTELLVIIITALVATLGLSMGLAFALGSKPVVAHILAGHFLRQNLPRGMRIEVLGHQGDVLAVGAIHTILSEGEERWTIPNGKLLDAIWRS